MRQEITNAPRNKENPMARQRTSTATTIAFANHKGGCGKTTAVGNLGAALAEMGERVLLIDADPQANLSELFGLGDAYAPGTRLEDALVASGRRAPAPWTQRPDEHGQLVQLACGVQLMPCTEELAQGVMDHEADDGFEYRLRQLVDAYRPDYDYILIDTPPGIQPLTSMAMLAADWVLVPARPADFDITGAVKVADFIEARISVFNPALGILGVLVCQTDRRWRIGQEAREALAAAGVTQLPHEIPFATRVGAAPRYAMPTLALEPDSRVAAAYRQVASDLADRLAPRGRLSAVPA